MSSDYGLRKCTSCGNFYFLAEPHQCGVKNDHAEYLAAQISIASGDLVADIEAQAMGVKFDDNKPALGLIPALALEAEGRVWGAGAKKYSALNWHKGLLYSRILGASMRHLAAIMRGEDRDIESGEFHAAHVRCNMAMLIQFMEEGRTELDDRLKTNKSPMVGHNKENK